MTRRLIALAAALPLLVGATYASAQDALPLGAEIPLADRVMENAAGPATSFAQEMGSRGLVVVFWSSTCPWVRRYEERLMHLAEDYIASGVGIVAVNPNDPAAVPGDNLGAMREHAAETRYPFAYVVDADSEAARAFGASRTPQVFVFDETGRLVYEGAIDDSPADARQVRSAHLRNALAAVVAGEPVRVEKTRAFGCTIKFPE